MVLLSACTVSPFAEGEGAAPHAPPPHEAEATLVTPSELRPELPAICINELMADNVNSVASPDGTVADWVELHNPTEAAVDLDGWTLGDDEESPLDGLSLAPGAYLLLWADGRVDAGPGHLAEALDADGGELELRAPDGGEAVLDYGAMESDWAAARVEPCGAEWGWAWHGTPGWSNAGSSSLVLLEAGASWRWLDTGVAPAEDWIYAYFDDTSWAEGPAPLGYGDAGIVSTVSYGADGNNKLPTTWFRTRFEGADGLLTATLELQVDDGAALWLDGVEIARINLDVAADASSWAQASMPAETAWWRFELDPALVGAGEHQLAAEVHQHSASSSDLAWAATLTGER